MIDLHELANMPGAGRAQHIIKNKGMWLEDYTFDDVCDFLDHKHVTVVQGASVLFRHDGNNVFEKRIEDRLRDAMDYIKKWGNK